MYVEWRVVFEEPWHIGSGEGAGRFLDALARRDGHGLPFVPGSTLRGLARDALRRLAAVLGVETCDGTLERREGEPVGALCGVTREGVCPLCALTGSPHRPGRVRWGPGRLVLGAEAEEAGGRRRRRLADQANRVPAWLARAHPHTAIDRASGRAADERLFTVEEVRPGLELAGRLELDADLAPREVALLVAALRFVREIGGGRRRGLGSCRVHIDGADLGPAFADWREAVRSLERPPAPAGPTERRSAPPAELAPSPVSLGTTVLRVDATVVGEVALGGRPEAGNQVAGLAFAPGSTLRGALAARWRGERGSEEFLRCFVSGRLRFGYLYPLPGQRAAPPMPLSIHTCKRRPGPAGEWGHGLTDLLLKPDPELCPEPECGARLRPWGPCFGEPERAWQPELLLSPHNRVDPRTQAVAETSLFAYQALPEGAPLRGFVRADSEEDLALLLAGLSLAPGERFRLRAGRRKGALGHLECSLAPYTGLDSGVGLFPDAPPPPDPWPAGWSARVDLLTPAILADEHLRLRESLTPADLGLPGRGFAAGWGRAEILAGWNSAHRLPKSEQLAVAAGSSYLLAEAGAAELAALSRAAREGVGLRRAEGFGAIAFSAVAPAAAEGGA